MDEESQEGCPSDGVESFAEIKFEDHRRGFTGMTTIEQVSRIDKVFRNGAPIYEPCLVVVNKERYQGFQSICEELGNGFWRAILKGDGPEIICRSGYSIFQKEDHEGGIETINTCV